MRKSLNTFRWYENAWAAFIFFTRLPFYKLYSPPRDCYKAVVEFWPLTGWLTASVTAAVLYFGSWLFPGTVAVALALLVRLLLTGALHEDGLADFCDGFGGGGTDRQRILEIMKDSRIGTYGVLGLFMYGLLFYLSLNSLSVEMAALIILCADPYSKMLAGQLVQLMPYARTEQEAKSRMVYRKISLPASIGLAVQGLLPVALLFYLKPELLAYWEIILFVPCLVMYFLYRFIWSKLRGYTGDCCGALFLLIELSIYLTISILCK
jgi:adenosylcobinamide-GDP ribazoletransferase